MSRALARWTRDRAPVAESPSLFARSAWDKPSWAVRLRASRSSGERPFISGISQDATTADASGEGGSSIRSSGSFCVCFLPVLPRMWSMMANRVTWKIHASNLEASRIS